MKAVANEHFIDSFVTAFVFLHKIVILYFIKNSCKVNWCMI